MPAAPSRAALPLAVFFGGWLIAGAEGATNTKTNPATSVVAKTTDITLPLKDSGLNLGDIVVQMAGDGSISLQRAGLMSAVKRILRQEAAAALENALAHGDYVSLAQVETAGLPCSFNSESLEIQVSPKVEQRPRGEITGSVGTENSGDEALAQRALVSGYVNMQFGAAYNRAAGDGGLVAFPAAVFEGASRFADVVIETEAEVDEEGKAIRRGSRAIYDLPFSAVRVTAGDLTSLTGGTNMLPPMLGISVEKSFKKLQPLRNVRPTGKRSFRVERPSSIEVMLNGRPVRSLKIGPGEYDLDSLPLTAGSNKAHLIIKDDTGNIEELDFAILFDRALLAVGITEWDVTAGFASHADGALSYDYDDPYVSAAYRVGLLESATGRLSLLADRNTLNGGADTLVQTKLGLLALETMASLDAGRLGLFGAADFEVELDSEDASSLSLGLELVGKGFVLPGAEKSTKDARIRARGSYSRALGDYISSTFSAHYAFAGADGEDTFGASFSLSRPMGDGLNASLSAGYGSAGDSEGRSALLPGLSVFGRLSYRLGESANLNLGYDAAASRFTAAAATSSGSGIGGWSTQVEMAREPGSPGERASNSVEGSFSYTGNRFSLDTTHGRDFTGLNDTRQIHHSATLGTAMAFADGQLAIGRPVRGSFAVVDAHPTLKDSRLRLSPSEDGETATSDWLGAAVVSDISAYSPTHFSYDVEDLPPGYDVGSGSFDLIAPYKGGYRLTVGSGFTVTITGTLADAAGNLLRLLSGVAFDKRAPDRKITIFTTAEGRFGGQGFGPGQWVVEIAAPGAPRFTFSLPSDATGVIDVGNLSPSQTLQ